VIKTVKNNQEEEAKKNQANLQPQHSNRTKG
jgi:hypothetical protein